MLKFRLPKNSQVRPGKVHRAAKQNVCVRRFHIYRYDPASFSPPSLDTYELDAGECGPMVLDVLTKIMNELDPTLTFRRSCRERICGSCAMNIDGTNSLACTRSCDEVNGDVRIYPLPHLPVIKDLAADLSTFYTQYASIQPWLQSKPPAPLDSERLQSSADQKHINRPSSCTLCACCSTSCPSYWWNSDRYLSPAALLAAYPWIIDSRDEATRERLDAIGDSFRLYRCHTIMNCTEACTKDLNLAKAIAKVKKLLFERRL